MERIAPMMSTPCPDEDTYARFLQGILPAERIADIERHIDVCPRCAELGAQFGKLYAPPPPAREAEDVAPEAGAPEATRGGARPLRWLLGLELLMLSFHAVAAIALLPAAWRAAGAGVGPTLTVAAAAYAVAWVPIGGAVAAVAAWALQRGYPWGRAIARAHALVSLPSVVLTPLAALVLRETRARKRRGPSLG
jgi:anti-sigma factor RsiW